MLSLWSLVLTPDLGWGRNSNLNYKENPCRHTIEKKWRNTQQVVAEE
jgi:hypothetical protein